MNLKTIVAIFVMAAVPVCSQAQQRNDKIPPKSTKADAERVVKIISGDKAKSQQYCDLAKLDEQIGEAEAKKDTKKVDALTQQLSEMEQKLGPEYVAFMDGVQQVDPNSSEGKDITSVLDALDKLCGKK
jgi:hypothetical protein